MEWDPHTILPGASDLELQSFVAVASVSRNRLKNLDLREVLAERHMHAEPRMEHARLSINVA